MELFEKPILLIALALVLAIGIERILEMMRTVADYLEARNGTVNRWQKIAEKVRDRIEVRLELARTKGQKIFVQALTLVCRYLSRAPAESGGGVVIATDQIRMLGIKLACRIYGVVLGIVLAGAFHLNIFELVDAAIHASGDKIVMPVWLGIILSGFAMGLGAGPVHKLIVSLERLRKG